jgi:peroxiredoxin
MTPPVAQQTQDSTLAATLREYQTESGRNLLDLLDESPILLIFLRHFGCSFCRETLDDVSRIRGEIEAKGIRPVFVHLGTPERAKPYFDYYHLSDIERVSDPEATLYARPVFALPRQSVFSNFLVLKVWAGWLRTLPKMGIGLIKEDAEQLPGIFFLRQREIARSFRYKTIADRPNYKRLIG